MTRYNDRATEGTDVESTTHLMASNADRLMSQDRRDVGDGAMQGTLYPNMAINNSSSIGSDKRVTLSSRLWQGVQTEILKLSDPTVQLSRMI